MRLFRKKLRERPSETDRTHKPAEEVCGPRGNKNAPFVEEIEIIYRGSPDGFSLAIGKWTDTRFQLNGERMLLMRWNGLGNDRGYPYFSRGNLEDEGGSPIWFPIPSEFCRPILQKMQEILDGEDPKCAAQRLGFVLTPSNCS